MCSTLTMMPTCEKFTTVGKKSCKPSSPVNSILPSDLAQELQKFITGSSNNDSRLCIQNKQVRTSEPVMLLDCRSFLAYNFKHIAGAINVNCTTNIAKKRLQQGKISLVDLVTSENGKECLRNGNWAKAVVYDECTSELEKAPSSHPIKLVLSSLLNDGKEAFLLKGGLKEFSQCYQDLLSVHSAADHNEGVSNAVERINTITKIQQDIATRPNPGCPLNVRATEVLSNVYLGNATDATDHEFLTKNNIRYILNLTCQCPNYFAGNPEFHYKQIKIEDSCRENIKEIIADAIDFIDHAKADQSSVLIHCQGGVSRSPTVTIAYLMHLNKLSLKDAYQFVKEKRPCIAPNLNFMGQLLEMEMKVRGVENVSVKNDEVLKSIGCS